MPRADSLLGLHEGLSRLLQRQGAQEVEFQEWFEQNSLIFEVLGYRRWIAKPRMEVGDKFYEPDFVVQDHRGVWSVFELKRPDTVVHKQSERRQNLRAEFSDYVQQCREYAEYFLDAANRAEFESRYGARVQRKVPSVLLASLDEATNYELVHDLLSDRGNLVELLTYSMVLSSIERELDNHTADQALQPGRSVTLLCSIPTRSRPGEQTFLEFGSVEHHERFAIGIVGREYFFRLVDAAGQRHEVRAAVPLIVDYANGLDLTILEVEFGVSRDELYLAAFANRRCLARHTMNSCPLNPAYLLDLVIGSDFSTGSASNFIALELIVYDRTISWREREAVRQYLEEIYRYYLSPFAIHQPAALHFAPGTYLKTNNSATSPRPSGGLWAWYSATSVQLANGAAPPPDPRLQSSRVRLPGLPNGGP